MNLTLGIILLFILIATGSLCPSPVPDEELPSYILLYLTGFLEEILQHGKGVSHEKQQHSHAAFLCRAQRMSSRTVIAISNYTAPQFSISGQELLVLSPQDQNICILVAIWTQTKFWVFL